MRIICFAAAVPFLFAPLAETAKAEPLDRADFVSWALERGAECDERWEIVAGQKLSAAAGLSPARAAYAESFARPRVASGRPRTVDFCSPAGLVKTMASGVERLSLSTRERGAPSRGKAMKVSPAETRLNELSAEHRSFGTSLRWTTSFHTARNAVRPALKSCGRVSGINRVRGPARPASRTARPRRF